MILSTTWDKTMIASNMAMSPIQIASNVIDKLQEENRISLETLHKTQNEIKHLQRQLLEKDQLIKILEERLRRGSNTYLEMNNRQKEITIKHLELQIQKLLKENQELDVQINSVKLDICGKCENKLVSCVSGQRKSATKACVKKSGKDPPTKTSNSENREKMLERIIEHKDKRIGHLSKEVQKLNQVEKELTNKIYRLTKLLPMSQMPSEMLIETLLNEIKSLETQIQLHRGIGDTSKRDLFLKGVGIPSHSNLSGVTTRSSTHKRPSIAREPDKGDGAATLVSNMHRLFHDVEELKLLFASENERMHQNLTKNSVRQDTMKVQFKDVVRRLNDIAESIQAVIVRSKSVDVSSEKEATQRLQDMLRSCLELNSQHEEENALLKARLDGLTEQLLEETETRKTLEKIPRCNCNINGNQQVNQGNQTRQELLCAETQVRKSLEELSRCKESLEVAETGVRRGLEELSRLDRKDRSEFAETRVKKSLEELSRCKESLEFVETRVKRSLEELSRLDRMERSESAETRVRRSLEELSRCKESLEVAETGVRRSLEELSRLERKDRSEFAETRARKSLEELSRCKESLEVAGIEVRRSLEELSRLERGETRVRKSLEELPRRDSSSDEVQELKAKLKDRQRQLDFAENHLKTCQALIEELQKLPPKEPAKRLVFNDPIPPETARQLRSLEKKLEVAEKNIASLEGVIEELQGVVRNLEEDNSRLDSELHVARLGKVVSDAGVNQYAALKTRLDDALDRLTTVGRENEELLRRLDSIEEENRELKKELGARKSTGEQLPTLRRENEELQGRLDLSEVENRELRKDLSVRKSREGARGEQLTTLRRGNKELQDRLDSMEEENGELRRELSVCKSREEGTEEQLATLRRENEELRSRLDSIEGENLELRKSCRDDAGEQQLAALRRYNEELLGRLDSLEEDNSELRKDLNACKKNAEERSKLERTIAMLEENVVRLQTSLEKLREENAELRLKERSASQSDLSPDVSFLRREVAAKDEEMRGLRESLETLERRVFEVNHYRKALRREIGKLCDSLGDDGGSRRAVYDAAVLQSAQAILRMDCEGLAEESTPDSTDALEEMKQQVSVYLTEVARIHELLTLKSQQREDLVLRQYLRNDVDKSHESDAAAGPSVVEALHGSSSTGALLLNKSTSSQENSPLLHSRSAEQGGVSRNRANVASTVTLGSDHQLRRVEELEASRSTVAYFASKCSELEDLLERERQEKERRGAELGELRARAEEELAMERLKGEVRYLMEENQKTLEKVSRTQSELRRCQEENDRVQGEVDSLRRQLLDERYQHARVSSELRHLRAQLSSSSQEEGIR